MEQVKVGDTFRVFKVIHGDLFYHDFKGRYTIEVKDLFYKNNYGVNTFFRTKNTKNLYFSLKELKQVATVRITKLK